MIDSPKNLVEQLLNFVEQVAIEMRAMLNTIKGKADTSALDAYLTKTDAEKTYATKTDLDNTSAGADATQLCEQMIAFYNSMTGSSLDYRDYLDHKSGEFLDAFYAFGLSYTGES